MQALQLGHDDPNILRSLRHLQPGEALHGLAEGERVHVRADAAHPLDQGDRLHVVAPLRQPLDAAKAEPTRSSAAHRLTFARELQLLRLFQGG